MNSVELPRKIVNQILAHAQSEDDAEICGLISKSDAGIFHCYPVKNISSTPECLFLMDGKEQVDAMRAMRSNDESLFAIYHSHPHSEAFPSKTDLDESQYPGAIYLIVSLDTKGVLDLRAYRYQQREVEILELSISG